MEIQVNIKGSAMLTTIIKLCKALDLRFKGVINSSQNARSLLHLLNFPQAELLPSILTCALKYYNSKDNVFNINDAVLCTSLEDVKFLTGLPISGKPVIMELNRDPNGFNRCFGLDLKPEYNITEMASIVKDDRYTNDQRKKALLLLLVRCFIVPSANGHTVNTTYLKLIEDLDQVDSYAWGAALLAYLYKGISDYRVDEKRSLDGNSWLLLGFLILRIPKLQTLFEIELEQLNAPILSTIIEQFKRVGRNRKKDYSKELKNIFQSLSNNDINWTLYISFKPGNDESARTTYVGPIFCGNYVYYHQPHLAASQFRALANYHHDKADWHPRVIKIKDNRGPGTQKLLEYYQVELNMWNAGQRAEDILRPKVHVAVVYKRRMKNFDNDNNDSRREDEWESNGREDECPADNDNNDSNRNVSHKAVLATLEPGKWIHIETIYYYIRYLKRTISPKALARSILLDCYTYSKWKDTRVQGTVLQQWSSWWKGRFDECSYIFFPICHQSHFSLVIVCFIERENLETILMFHLDSKKHHSSSTLFDVIEWGLQQTWKGDPSHFPAIVKEVVEVPQQPNTWDCGLYVMHMLKLFLEQAPEKFQSEDLKKFGKNWFDPRDASESRQAVKKIAAEEMDRCFDSPASPPPDKADEMDGQKRKVSGLRSAIRTPHGTLRPRQEIKYLEQDGRKKYDEKFVVVDSTLMGSNDDSQNDNVEQAINPPKMSANPSITQDPENPEKRRSKRNRVQTKPLIKELNEKKKNELNEKKKKKKKKKTDDSQNDNVEQAINPPKMSAQPSITQDPENPEKRRSKRNRVQ